MSYGYRVTPRSSQLMAQKRIFQAKRQLIWGDMGTGKTKIGVDFIGNMVFHKRACRALVICPLEAFGVWEDELEKNCPSVSYSFMGSDFQQPDWAANIIITNYDFISPRRKKKISRSGKVKKKIDWKMVETLISWSPEIIIIDEGHKIKNPTSRRSKALHKLGLVCEYAIDLTGTPTGNKRVIDFWSQFKFLKPDLLDEKFKDHKSRYAIWGGFGGFQLIKYRNVEHFAKIVAPYIFRIKTEGLPPQNFIPYKVVLPPKAKALYNEMEEEYIIELEKTTITAQIALSKAMKLCQMAGGFVKDNDGNNHTIHTAKVDALRQILENLREQDTKRIVIFARFLWEIDQIKELLDYAGWTWYRVKGRLPKEEMIEFNEGKTNVMICQCQSGSLANNFQAANYMIFYSADYSLINWQQAVKRIHRIGQDKPCFYYMLMSKGTVDSFIYRQHRNNGEASKNFSQLVEEIKERVA